MKVQRKDLYHQQIFSICLDIYPVCFLCILIGIVNVHIIILSINKFRYVGPPFFRNNLHFFKMKLLRCCVNTPLRCFHACMQHPNTTIRHHQTHLIKIPKVPSFQTPLPYQILFCGFQFLLPLAIWLLSYFVSINVTVSYIILFLFLSLHST